MFEASRPEHGPSSKSLITHTCAGICSVRFHSPPILAFWRASVGPPVLNGSPEGGFITLVWSAESEFVLKGERHRQRVKGGEEQRLGGGEG